MSVLKECWIVPLQLLKTKLTKDIFEVEDHIRDSHNSSHPKPSTTLLYILFERLEKIECKSIQVFEF